MTDASLAAMPALKPGGSTPEPPRASGPDRDALRRAAVEFETIFLAEALTAAGLGRTPEGFGGGVGEDAFASLLVREQARLLAEQGGIGLAERIYQSLVTGSESR